MARPRKSTTVQDVNVGGSFDEKVAETHFTSKERPDEEEIPAAEPVTASESQAVTLQAQSTVVDVSLDADGALSIFIKREGKTVHSFNLSRE